MIQRIKEECAQVIYKYCTSVFEKASLCRFNPQMSEQPELDQGKRSELNSFGGRRDKTTLSNTCCFPESILTRSQNEEPQLRDDSIYYNTQCRNINPRQKPHPTLAFYRLDLKSYRQQDLFQQIAVCVLKQCQYTVTYIFNFMYVLTHNERIITNILHKPSVCISSQ